MGLGLSQQRQHVGVGIDDTGRRGHQGTGTVQLRLQRNRLCGADEMHIGHAIVPCGPDNFLKRCQLLFIRGDDQLATTLVGHPTALTVVIKQIPPADTEPGLERAPRIIDTRMDHFAVARAGPAAEGALTLQNQNFPPSQG